MVQTKDPLPLMFLPPIDMAHDIYALAIQTKGLDHNLYQDIQQDKAVYGSFQRWPYLFKITLANPPSEESPL